MASVTAHKQRQMRKHARTGKKHPKGQVKGDINVTPLVDVVLVLLIIFMVVTPMISGGVQVDLPRTANHSKKPDDGKDIIISITRGKQVYFAGRPLSVKDVSRVIEDEKRRFPEKTIFVKGDSMATYGSVRDVMEAINKTGIEDVMLGTEEIKSLNAPAAGGGH
jgi:biopolymer transport protein ExbD/biopolymer transport protein TolR